MDGGVGGWPRQKGMHQSRCACRTDWHKPDRHTSKLVLYIKTLCLGSRSIQTSLAHLVMIVAIMLQLLDLNASSHVALLGASFIAATFIILCRAGLLSEQDHDSKTPSIWPLLLSPTEKVKSRFNAWSFLFQGPFDGPGSLRQGVNCVPPPN